MEFGLSVSIPSFDAYVYYTADLGEGDGDRDVAVTFDRGDGVELTFYGATADEVIGLAYRYATELTGGGQFFLRLDTEEVGLDPVR